MVTPLQPRASTDSFEYYAYNPSLPAAIALTILFTLALAAHTFQMFRARTWFMIPFVIGGLLEAGGYACRVISATENPGPWSLGPYLVQALLVLIAPTLFAASIYMELGRIVRMIEGEKELFVPRRWLTKVSPPPQPTPWPPSRRHLADTGLQIFVIGDLIAFGIQSTGGSLLSSDTPSTVDAGNWIIIGGLVVQILSFGMFVLAATLFHIRIARRPTALSPTRPWSKHMISLYLVSGLIFVRCAFRLVEYVQGHEGYLMSHEVWGYVFDAALMLLAVGVMNVVHPGEVARFVRALDGGKEGRREERELTRGVEMA